MNEPFTAEAYLKAAGITPTLQRTIVMDDLYHNRTHATIEEIYERLSAHYPKVTQRTIYNTINLFVAKGLVSELTIDEKCARYDFDTSVHTHFQCTDCGFSPSLMSTASTQNIVPFPQLRDQARRSMLVKRAT